MREVQVLIVDDQQPFRTAAAAVVQSMQGFTVAATAASGEEAMAVARTVPIDLVLMDVVMPGMSGIEAARTMADWPDPPVIVLVSTYDAADLGADLDTCGAAAYVSKSAFDPDKLREIWLERV